MDMWLFWIGFALIVLGLGLSIRAIYIVTAKRGLDAAWLRGMRRTREVARAIKHRLMREPRTTGVDPGRVHNGGACIAFAVTVTASGTAGPPTLEKRIEALEQAMAEARAAITTQADDLSSRIDFVRTDAEALASTIEQRIMAAEQESDKVDAVAFNSEMLGVACIALGTLIQAVSTLT